MSERYRQVRITQEKGPNSKAVSTCWIPSADAVVGRRYTLRDLPGIWTVEEVFDSAPIERLRALEKEQREVASVLKGDAK